MNIRFLILFLFLCIANSFAQKTLKGRVVSVKNEPLVGASVYLNNTSIGTVSDDKGKFEFEIPDDGTYELIISFLGYITIRHEINTKEINKPFLFRTAPKLNELDEVVVTAKKKKRKSSKYRKRYFYRFKNAFLGKTKNSENCKIENPEVLDYFFDEDTKVLTVEASEPIKIYNKDLGYRVYYDLIGFKLHKQRIQYSGYTRYEQLKGSKRKEKNWKKNRLIAYNGSLMHFLRALISDKTKEEGFIIDQFKRKKNKHFPTEEQLKFARKTINDFIIKNKVIEYRKITKPKTKLDSAILIRSRARKDRFIDSLVTKNVKNKNIILRLNQKIYLSSNYPLRITYTKEKEERGYRPGIARLDKQISKLILFETPLEILTYGQFANPLATLSEKYWGYEQFAEMLPLDYKPPKD